MDEDTQIDEHPAELPTKRQLIRDAVVFQVKLIVDGIRDFVLIPVSLVATVLSLLKPGKVAGSEFYDVVTFGKETEERINLFSAARPSAVRTDELPAGDLDQVIDQVEQYVSKELQGERMEQARARLDVLLKKLKAQSGAKDDG
ncbi:MAG: hypothetical protein AB8F65_02785 [Woeseiaceae bacterium]